MLYDIDDHQITIKGPLDASRRRSLKHMDYVFVEDGADEDLFDQRRTFPRLFKVFLRTAHNVRYLRALSVNYPELKCISISQSDPLSEEECNLIGQFHKLSFFGLHGTVANPRLFVSSIPSCLQEFYLSDSDLTESNRLMGLHLKNLCKASFVRCHLEEGLLSNVGGTKIEVLCLESCWIPSNGLQDIGRFGKLREISLARSVIDGRSLEALKEISSLRTLVIAQVAISPQISDRQAAESIGQCKSLKIPEVEISDDTDDWLKALKKHRVRELRVHGLISPEQAESISRLNISLLSLKGCFIESGALAKIGGMMRLDELDLSESNVSGNKLVELSTNSSLNTLKLMGTTINSTDVQPLLGHPRLWIVGYTRL